MAAPLTLGSCGGGRIEPQYVTFDYQRKAMTPQELAMVASALQAGTRSLPDSALFGSQSCQFSTNLQTGRVELAVNGDPRTGSSNLVLRADNDLQRPSNACPAAIGDEARDVAIQTGNNIRLGQVAVNSGEAIVTVDGERFSSAGHYLRFELLSLNGDYAVGRFEFLARNIDDLSDTRVLIVSNGNFAVED